MSEYCVNCERMNQEIGRLKTELDDKNQFLFDKGAEFGQLQKRCEELEAALFTEDKNLDDMRASLKDLFDGRKAGKENLDPRGEGGNRW